MSEPREVEIKLLSMADLTEMLSVQPRTIYRWIEDGCFPKAIRFNRRNHRWFRHQIVEFLENLQQADLAEKE